MSIRPLPQVAADRIKSAATITSLNDVASGLLKNSLDARCSKVKIHVDYALGNCSVEDNGLGIMPSEFKHDGGLSKMHHTSKTPQSPSIHGSHGDFLAFVATFSLLTVTSHHYQYASHNCLSVHNGAPLSRPQVTPLEQRFDTFSHGTRVSVRNLFGSMPVRVKQRGLMFSDRAGIDKEWATLILEITGLLLGWPSDLSVFMREESTQKEIRLKSGVPEIMSRTARMFLQASLADAGDSSSWVPVSASSRRARIKGCISTNPVATKRSQVMNLGIRPIPNSFGTNVLYEEINKIFRDSNFGVVEPDATAGGRSAGVKSKPRKGIERWPMFYFEIHLLGLSDLLGVDDVLGDSQHILQVILDLLKVICYGFLKKYQLQPRAIHTQSNAPETSTSMASRRSSRLSKDRADPTGHKLPRKSCRVQDGQGIARSQSPFDRWNRGKVGWATSPAQKSSFEQPRTVALQSQPEPAVVPDRLVGENGKLIRKPFGDLEDVTQLDTRSNTAAQAHDDQPDSATTKNCAAPGEEIFVSNVTAESEEMRPKTHRILESRLKSKPEPWLDGVLRSWRNPVFEIVETHVPRLDHESANHQDDQRRKGVSKFFGKSNDVQFEAAALTLDSRLSRTLLADAEVIGQVDKKFLLLRLPVQKQEISASSALIMLDQHAADERCRLEALMAEYFEIPRIDGPLCAKTGVIDRPIVFEVSHREAKLLDRCREHFKTWGIFFKAQNLNEQPSSTASNHNVEVTSLPPCILERCQAEPRLVIDLIRKEIWKLEDRNNPPQPTHQEGRPWPSSFHNCPHGILELLHSRSCRSAIMFNDELSMVECTQLLQRLARCAYPFQCAHGRPSMAPVVDIGSGTGRLGGWDQGPNKLDVAQWKAWMAS